MSIESGRQLPRTPPQDVRRLLEEPQQNSEAGNNTDEKKMRTSKTSKTENTSKPTYSDSMLKGMKGYHLTPGDLEFIEKMKEEKLIRKLQGDLEKVQRELKKEKLALNLVSASRDETQAELNKFPSCEEINQWIMSVLKVTSPSVEVTGLDTRSLLAMVTEESVHRAIDKKEIELAQMENMLENKGKEEAQERGHLRKIIAAEQLKIQRMMHQLSDLTSELSQVESYSDHDAIRIKTSRGKKDAAAVGGTSEEQRGKHGRKERKHKKEKLQDTKTQSRSMRSKCADGETGNQAGVKENHANKDANETPKTSTADKATKPVKVKRPARKVQEQEPKSQESAPVVRERRKTPAASHVTAAPQQKSQTKAKSAGRAALAPRNDGEESQSAGPRRSKRIASRR